MRLTHATRRTRQTYKLPRHLEADRATDIAVLSCLVSGCVGPTRGDRNAPIVDGKRPTSKLLGCVEVAVLLYRPRMTSRSTHHTGLLGTDVCLCSDEKGFSNLKQCTGVLIDPQKNAPVFDEPSLAPKVFWRPNTHPRARTASRTTTAYERTA